MRFIVITLILAITLSIGSVAAEDAVKEEVKKDEVKKERNSSIIIDLTANQLAYSDSWEGGEAGSVSWASNLVGITKQNLAGSFNLTSTLKLSFGQSFSQDEVSYVWSKPKKSLDLIDLENIGRLSVHGWVDPYVGLRIETQFVDAKNSNKKFSLSPMTITESVGASRQVYTKNKDNITSRLGLGVRQILRKTIVDSTMTNGAVTGYIVEDSNFVDGGLEMVTDAHLTLGKNLHYIGKLSLFKAVFFSKKDALAGTVAADDWKAIDVNWEHKINAKVAKFVTVNLYLQFLYDKQIVDKGRFKQTLALGLSYTLY